MSPLWPDGQSVQTQARATGADWPTPEAFCWNGAYHRILHHGPHWRVHTDWWTEKEIWRDYWQVATDTGWLCVIYHDRHGDAWYLERVYE